MSNIPATQGVMFDFQSAQDIADAVRRSKQQQPGQQPVIPSPTKTTEQPAWYAQLQGEDPANPGFYAWKKMDIISGVFATALNAFADTDFTACDPNLTTGRTGENVVMKFIGYNDASTASTKPPRYLVISGGGGGVPTGELQGMAYMNVTVNQMGSSYPFAHELI